MKEKEVEYLLRSMNEEKANRIQRYKRRDQYRSIIGEMIIKKYGVNPNCVSDVTFEFNKYGKPYLRGIEFNISHYSNWVVCAISTNKIGIDIEKVIDLDINIVDQYFHPIELNWMKKGTDKERLLKFYQLWTKKESFIKAIGKGM